MQSATVKDSAQNPLDSASGLDFAELFQQYYSRVYNYLRYRVNSPEDAEDLISITFEKAYAYREQYDPDKGAFSTWLFRIAHNSLVNYYRTHQRRAAREKPGDLPADLVTPEATPESQLIKKESIGRILAGLERLAERDREIISLKFAGQLSNKEIGQIMELKENTVRVVLWRAMQRLQKEVTGESS